MVSSPSIIRSVALYRRMHHKYGALSHSSFSEQRIHRSFVSSTSSSFSSTSTSSCSASSSSDAAVVPQKIGIVMMNMGGPSSLDGTEDGVEPFLTRLFSDKEIIMLGPLQKWLGPYISRKRSPRIKEQYRQIGGKSPIGLWTKYQSVHMLRKLNHIVRTATTSSSSIPSLSFQSYVTFRYAPPLTENTLHQMAKDNIQHGIVFSQYPQFSCTTTGSSLNHLWRETIRLGYENRFTWSIIDRWPTHPLFINAVARCVAVGLQRFPTAVRDKVIIVFSAHSVPMLVVNRGDPYVTEIASTVGAVMNVLRNGKATLPVEPSLTVPPSDPEANLGTSTDRSPPKMDDGTQGIPVPPVRSSHILAWQSKVGFLPWMGPSTADVIKGLGKQGHKYVLMVPIAFTSDHIETLFEIDIEYRHEAQQNGILQFERAPSLNSEETLTTAQAHIIAEHIGILQKNSSDSNSNNNSSNHPHPPPLFRESSSPQYKLNCAGCTNPACRTILNPLDRTYTKLRDDIAETDGITQDTEEEGLIKKRSSSGCKTIPGSPWPSNKEVERLKQLTGPSP